MSGKTHKGLAKRLKVTGTGKVMHRTTGRSHLMSGVAGKRAMRLRQWRRMNKSDQRLLERQFGAALKP